jgi:hypothetical protein
MAPWPIITGSGLDDWIYWQLLLQLLIITISYKNSQIIFSRILLPWLPRTRSILILVLRLTSDLRLDYLYSLETDHRKHLFLYCIYSALHSNGSYTIVSRLFVAACFCRLYLVTGFLPRICPRGSFFIEPLSSNGSTCHSTFRWSLYYAHLRRGLPSWLFHIGSTTKIMYAYIISFS